jgi:DNA polymerase-3 subunit gamma/tau
MQIIDEIVFSGKDVFGFIKEMTVHMRNLMMVKVSTNPDGILDMSEENIELVKEQAKRIRIEEIMRDIRILEDAQEGSKWAKQSRIYLELAAIKMCKIQYDTSMEVVLSRLNRLEETLKSGNVNVAHEASELSKSITPQKIKKQEISNEPLESDKNIVCNEESNLTLDMVRKRWKDILEAIKSRRKMVLFTTLTTGEVIDVKGGVVTIRYSEEYAFNKHRLDKEENKKVAEDIFSEVLKEKIRIKCITEQNDNIDKSPEEKLKEVFGEDKVEIIDG